MLRRLLTTTACLCAAASTCSAAAKRPPKPPTPQEIQRMEAAAPSRAPAKPAKPRVLLAFTKCQGFVHASIPHAVKALEIMGKKTGAFRVVASDDIAVFEPQSLARFDAVCMVHTTMRDFLPDDFKKLDPKAQAAAKEREKRLKKSFLDFVRGGKGLIGIHAATDCFYAWPEYGAMMGAYFWGHPWHEKVWVKLDDPAHPLCAPFRGQGFSITDEIYQFRAPYSRKTLRVLLSLDTTRTNMNKGKRIHRTDGDFAVSWIRRYGKGRVFYCSLGHRKEVFWNPLILRYYLYGIQYALGDLPADATPSAQLSKAYLEKSRREAQRAGYLAAFEDLKRYKLGGDDTAVRLLARRVIEAQQKPETRADLERRLAQVLQSDATDDAKRFACRQLFLIGSEASVPALAKLLTHPKLSDMARYALERMPTPAAGAALRAALDKTKGKPLVGVIDSLAGRRDAQAVPALVQRLNDADPAVAAAAADGLARIATPAAAHALAKARRARPGSRLDAAALACAQHLLAAGRAKEARALAQPLVKSSVPAVRAAAYLAVARSRPEDALRMTLDALQSDDEALRRAAVELARELPGAEATKALAAALPRLDALQQQRLLQVLADRGDAAARPAVMAAARGKDERVRVSAIRALAALGDASAASLLLERAAKARPDDEEQKAARAVLDRLPAPGVDAALCAALDQPDPAVRVEAIDRLRSRRAASAAPRLLRAAREDQDKKARAAALRALAVVAEPKLLPRVLALLAGDLSARGRTEAEKAAAAIAKRISDPARRCDAALAALAKAKTPDERASILRVLGRIGSPAGLPALRAAVKDPDKKVQDAAVRALSEWPTVDALDALADIAQNDPSPVHKVLALRGYARLIEQPSDRPAAESLRLVKRGLALCFRDDERKLMLSALGDVALPEALKLAESLAKNPTLQDEAMQAAASIYHRLSAPKAVTASRNPEKARFAIDGDPKTRWDTGRRQEPGQWFLIDLGAPRLIKSLTLDTTKSRNDYPKGYEVYVSMSKDDWGKPVAAGAGKGPVTHILCQPKTGRYIKIVQTKRIGGWYWSIHELLINGRSPAGDNGKKIADRSKWKATASVMADAAPKAFDGDIKTRWGTGGKQKPGQWLQIDLGEARKIRQIVLNAGDKKKDYPRRFKVYVSLDGKDWGPAVGGGKGRNVITAIPLYPKTGRYIKIVQTGTTPHWWWSVYEMDVFADPKPASSPAKPAAKPAAGQPRKKPAAK